MRLNFFNYKSRDTNLGSQRVESKSGVRNIAAALRSSRERMHEAEDLSVGTHSIEQTDLKRGKERTMITSKFIVEKKPSTMLKSSLEPVFPKIGSQEPLITKTSESALIETQSN